MPEETPGFANILEMERANVFEKKMAYIEALNELVEAKERLRRMEAVAETAGRIAVEGA